MIAATNLLTFIRGPIALLFLIHNPYIRLSTLVIAIVTDSIDGYIARKWRSTSRFGAVLDPIMDKFFVFFVLGVLIYEHKIQMLDAVFMLSRDIALCLFLFGLLLSKKWKGYKFKPARAGKLSTALQFAILFLITLNVHIPSPIYFLFAVLGVIVLCELCFGLKKSPQNGC